MRAYVIDDSKPVRGILSKMLVELNFETIEAGNGQDALDQLETTGRPDLFLVNWNMPVLDGLGFIETIRADPRYASVPLIVVSGEDKTSTMDRASSAGANDFLIKPVTEKSLRDRLRKLGFSISLEEATRPQSPGQQEAATPLNPSRRPQNLPPANTIKSQNRERKSQNRESTTTSSKPIRVLIVDDSVVVRGIVSKILQQDPELEVVATASDGQIAMTKLDEHPIDVVLLDIEMPNMDGFDVLRSMRQKGDSTPVVMFSSLTQQGGAATIEALMLGAKDYVAKPGGSYMNDTLAGKAAIQDELIPKIKQFAAPHFQAALAPSVFPLGSVKRGIQTRVEVIVIGISTGGPQALSRLLPKLGHDLPVPVLIVQHMPEHFTKHLADRLSQDCGFAVHEAADGEVIQAGHFLIAPGSQHLELTGNAEKACAKLSLAPPVNACRPSVDVLFQSASKIYGPGVLSIVMTGMGSDGTRGCEAILEAGGQVIVQDEPSSVVWGMPGSVVRARLAENVFSLEALPAEILTRVRAKRVSKKETGK